MISINETQCCGLDDISGIQVTKVKDIIEQVIDNELDIGCRPCFYLFTEETETKRGKELKKFIEKNKLGTVYATKSKLNTNSGNDITAYIWEVDKKAVEKYADKNCKDTLNEYDHYNNDDDETDEEIWRGN